MEDENLQVKLGPASYSVPPIPFRVATKIVPMIMARPNIATEEGFTAVSKIIFLGISISTPGLTYESFMDGHYRLEELMAALSIISTQAGLKAKESSPGEAMGVTSPLISKN